MKYLAALALLVLAVTEASHVPEHSLRGPRFERGKLYKYDVELNVTAGVLGLSSQNSASVLRAEVHIYAKTEKNYILKIQNVLTSGSVKAIDSKYGEIQLQPNRDLEDRLSSPIMFTLEDGKVTSYTLSRKENLESKKIKKSILRSLQMYVPESALQELENGKNLNIPVTYNTTEDTEYGPHSIQYMIIASPYVEFPSEALVYNISRSDNFEAHRYPAHKLHHNFQRQGCPDVCRKDWKTNSYGAGCPVGHEPHQGPIKVSFSHEHDLSPAGHVLALEIIRTVEVHYAKMYDQDMEVLFRYQLSRTRVTTESIPDPSRQKTYTDLADWRAEINEKEIEEMCNYKQGGDYVSSARRLIAEIATLIAKGDLQNDETTMVGEKIILLRDSLYKLSYDELQTLARTIKTNADLQRATDQEKVARQVWLNILPAVGSSESVKFIAYYAQDYNSLLKWEIKDLLESLPQNIEWPSEEHIRELRELARKVGKESHLLHSAAHFTLAKVIRKTCSHLPTNTRLAKQQNQWAWFGKSQAAPQDSPVRPPPCPEALVSEIVEEVTRNLRRTRKPEELAVYIDTLSHIGTPGVLPVIAEYAFGVAENIQESSPRFIDFMKTMALYALQNVAGNYPDEVLKIVYPIYFNETEKPKVRIAAFGALIVSQPSLEVLQKVAIESWTEKSYDVGSYVTSTLETFGNSSLPCMQLTARRIKLVFPHVRRFDVGMHHAKNYFWTYWDDLREFGLEKRIEYTPSNESYIPSVFYKSISYGIHSLREVVSQLSINNEGLTEEKIMEKITEYLRVPSIPTIEDEATVFGPGEKGQSLIKPRAPEELRFTFYGRLFYQTSYYYLDSSSYRRAKDDLMELLTHYLRNADRTIRGHLVKLMIPSSYHTVAIGKTLPYPVEFQMRQPIVLALSVKSPDKNVPARDRFNLQLRPSVYMTKLITHQVKNLGDCKEVGVYHEHKIAASYPFQIKYEGETLPNVTIIYKVPATQKRVLAYFTESGTYAGKKELERLPSSSEREPIRTRPTPFKFERQLNVVGLPLIHVQLYTEDMNIFREKLPREQLDVVDLAVRHIFNAGWRYKSVNITILEDRSVWSKDTEVTFSLKYLRQHVLSSSRRSEEEPMRNNDKWSEQWSRSRQPQTAQWKLSANDDADWARNLMPVTDASDMPTMTEKAREVARILTSKLSHMNHQLNITIETAPEQSYAYFRMEYNHTHNETLHSVHVETAAKQRGNERAYEMSFDHLAGYWNKPDEFTYDTEYGKQHGALISALTLSQSEERSPWKKPDIVWTGNYEYVSNREILEDELLSHVEEKDFLPETHEGCLKDVRAGQPLSKDCVKAIRELSIYNRLKMYITWKQELPKSWKLFFRRADAYLKHVFFENLNITEGERMENSIQVQVDYIDKFVDEPVMDVEIKKSSETLRLKRVELPGFVPFSSIYTPQENQLLEMTNNTYPPSCVLMENYIKTFDWKTYPFSSMNCHYVLATHCTKRKNFAVILHGKEELYIHVGPRTLILTPKRSNRDRFVIKFDNEEHKISEAVMLDSENEIYAYIETYGRRHEHLKVVAKKAGIKVTYDGKNVKVKVDPRYKGELCGLCSEFDGEEMREFRGIDRCLYQDYLDFANSALVKRDRQCRVEHYRGQRICDSGEHRAVWARGSTGHENYEPTTKRNIVISRGEEFCFSITPVPVCEGDDSPTETKSQQMGFHCLQKSDAATQRLVEEAKRRPLKELERKEVDYEEAVEIAMMC